MWTKKKKKLYNFGLLTNVSERPFRTPSKKLNTLFINWATQFICRMPHWFWGHWYPLQKLHYATTPLLVCTTLTAVLGLLAWNSWRHLCSFCWRLLPNTLGYRKLNSGLGSSSLIKRTKTNEICDMETCRKGTMYHSGKSYEQHFWLRLPLRENALVIFEIV